MWIAIGMRYEVWGTDGNGVVYQFACCFGRFFISGTIFSWYSPISKKVSNEEGNLSPQWSLLLQ